MNHDINLEMPKSKVYIQTDNGGSILRRDGGYTTPADLTGWTAIDEGPGDRYNLAQSHYFDGGLYTKDGIHRYRWDGSAAALRTEEELAADRAARPAPPPTTEEVLLELAADHEARLCGIELGV